MTRGLSEAVNPRTGKESSARGARPLRPNHRSSALRHAAASGVATLVLTALAGCAGGGGGDPASLNGVVPVAYAYPASIASATSTDTVDGFMSPYALDPTTPDLVSVLPTVSGTTPSTGTIAITVQAIPLPSGSEEPAFVVTFDPASGSLSPFDGVLGCTGCLKTATVQASYVGGGDAGQVTFTYLDPASASLTYSVLGMWAKPTADAVWKEVGGAFSAGVLTRGIDLPTTGSASYGGYFIGRYVTSGSYPAPGTYFVGADASATADFGAGSVLFWTSNTKIVPEAGVSTPTSRNDLNLTSTSMPITRTSTSNSFAGTATTQSGGLSGQVAGAFYGQPATTSPYAPPEVGGSLAVTNGTDRSMVGSFGLKIVP